MFELILLFCLLLILSLIVFSSIKIGISPTPSSFQAIKTINNITKNSENNTIIDLGSGFGFLTFYLAYKNNSKKIIGYEVSYVPYIISKLIQMVFRLKNISFRNENFLDVNFCKDTTYVCYLFPQAMKDLDNKILKENRSITLFISSTFALNTQTPTAVEKLNDLYNTPIYSYRI